MLEEMNDYPFEVVAALLDVNRRTINQLIEERDSARYDRHRAQQMEKEMSDVAMDYQNKLEGQDADLKAANEKIDKLKGVIETLKLELANEREAHTKAREAKTNG